MRGIEERLGDEGYTSLIANTDNAPERERVDFEAMRDRQVDGFITATARLDHELISEIADSGQPIVLVNRRVEDGALPGVRDLADQLVVQPRGRGDEAVDLAVAHRLVANATRSRSGGVVGVGELSVTLVAEALLDPAHDGGRSVSQMGMTTPRCRSGWSSARARWGVGL